MNDSLGATTNGRFNLCINENKETKRDVDPDTGFRAGLNRTFDRPLSELKPLVPLVPLARTILCINHGLSGITENLLSLTVTSASRLAIEVSAEERLVAVSHLTKNIRARGVRGGTFHFRYFLLLLMSGNVYPEIRSRATSIKKFPF